MLTFLRKKRRSLIDSGAIRKYLLYAIGEILLVMIGILLALQVNNWNEAGKERKVEKKAILDLKHEFESNYELFLKTMKSKEDRAEVLSDYLKLLSDKTIPVNQKNRKRPRLNISTWYPTNDVLISLLNTGKVESIKNDSLKYLLTSWKDVNKQYEELRASYQKQWDKVNQFEASRIPGNIIVEVGQSDYLFHTEEELQEYRSQIINDIEYQNHLIRCVNVLKIMIYQSDRVTKKYQQIKRMLERESSKLGI